MNNTIFFTKKLFGTIKIAFTLFMARTFGKYIHSSSHETSHNKWVDYAVYNYKGKTYIIPTTEEREDEF